MFRMFFSKIPNLLTGWKLFIESIKLEPSIAVSANNNSTLFVRILAYEVPSGTIQATCAISTRDSHGTLKKPADSSTGWMLQFTRPELISARSGFFLEIDHQLIQCVTQLLGIGYSLWIRIPKWILPLVFHCREVTERVWNLAWFIPEDIFKWQKHYDLRGI